MTPAIITVVFVFVLCGQAFWANARFCREARLPMQWQLNGSVTWSAPRPMALAFIPALALCVLVSLVVLPLYLQPRIGQEGMVVPMLVGIGALFVFIQLLHFWMIRKTLNRRNS